MSNSKNNQKVKAGVIGLGVMGTNHARVYDSLEGSELVAVLDTNPAVNARHAERYGVVACDSLDAMVDAGVEAVSIASPSETHLDVGLACMERGLHTLIEKPLAIGIEDCKKLVTAASNHRLKGMVGQIERYNPVLLALKELLANQDIVSMSITRVGPLPPRMSDVGVIIDLAVHDIDISRWLTGSEINRVQSIQSQTLARREDFALTQLRTESNILVQLNENWLTPFKKRSIEVATREKYIIADLITGEIKEYYDYQVDGTFRIKDVKVQLVEPLKRQLEDFVQCIVEDTPPAIPLSEGMINVAIAQQCLAQSKENYGAVSLA